MENKISIGSIQPFIRFSQLFSAGALPKLKAYDYRLFYVMSGSAVFICENKRHEINTDTLIIIPPQKVYQFEQNRDSGIELLSINFDYTQNCREQSIPIAPDTPENFKPEKITEIVEFCDAAALNSLVLLHNMINIKHELLEIYHEYHFQRIFFRQHICGLMISLIVKTARSFLLMESGKSADQNIVNEIIEYIRQNYNKNITNIEIGKRFNFHPNYINRLMVRNVGTSLYQYLLQIRISEAINLLQIGDMSIKQVASTVGFSDISHFAKYFKKKTGKTPSEYKSITNKTL